jgi:hypothetical protein
VSLCSTKSFALFIYGGDHYVMAIGYKSVGESSSSAYT